jgi:hypothetical protein
MSSLMDDVARLYRAEPDAMRAVMRQLRAAATPRENQTEAYAHAVGSVEGTLCVVEAVMEAAERASLREPEMLAG